MNTQPRSPDADADADSPCGCGWFDSSHDLRAGLVVEEHAGPEALPLGAWLDHLLAGWRVTSPGRGAALAQA